MAKKRTAPSGKRKKSSKNPPGIKTQLIKIGLGMFLLILLVVGAGILAHHLLDRPVPGKKVRVVKKAPVPKEPLKEKAPEKTPQVEIPTYEVYPGKEVAAVAPVSPVKTRKKTPDRGLPQAAVIIDDIGYDMGLAKKFIRLDSSLTISILPFGPFNDDILQLADSSGVETMLHLPMEPKEYPRIKPGPGALYSTMTPDALIAQLESDLNAVPGVKGVNNHMGSRVTADSDRMNQVFTILKKRGLYFVDSKTTPDSRCRSSARLFHVPFAERDVFIDHLQEKDFIRKQIRLLIRIARKYGSVVGIAHPHDITYEVMREMMPELKENVTIVPVSKLVEKQK